MPAGHGADHEATGASQRKLSVALYARPVIDVPQVVTESKEQS
jgi:hypothetical protein